MSSLYTVLTLVTATATGLGCWMNYIRHPVPVAAAKVVRVPESRIVVMGTLLGAGALGLLVGFVVPVLGLAVATLAVTLNYRLG